MTFPKHIWKYYEEAKSLPACKVLSLHLGWGMSFSFLNYKNINVCSSAIKPITIFSSISPILYLMMPLILCPFLCFLSHAGLTMLFVFEFIFVSFTF